MNVTASTPKKLATLSSIWKTGSTSYFHGSADSVPLYFKKYETVVPPDCNLNGIVVSFSAHGSSGGGNCNDCRVGAKVSL